MFSEQPALAVVTAILPTPTAERLVDVLHGQLNRAILVWKARGTALRDHWYARWLPPVSPVKEVLQLIVPETEIDAVLTTIVSEGRLDMQATGAVFAVRCESALRGEAFVALRDRAPARPAQGGAVAPGLQQNMQLLTCVMAPRYSDRVGRAAIEAGAHGPIVHYAEGRGLRDRLGWLRITKEQDKELLMVLSNRAEADDVFNSMARVGEFHLPGRGIMYSADIDKGMFNLPGLISHHRHAASMQQIINAIDHLQQHTHWRDQSAYIASPGLRRPTSTAAIRWGSKDPALGINAIARRDDLPELINAMLSAGAPGLNMNFSRIVAPQSDSDPDHGSARVSSEYAHLRCITDRTTAQRICQSMERARADGRCTDVFAYTVPVPRVALYAPGARDHRKAS